jgi:DNA-binding transcriptional LysR family regulator
MELRQLEYLVAVVEEGNFTRAAERVRISQSGISAQIRQLEKEVGLELVDRSDRVVRATAAGHAMLPYARAALGAVSGATLALDEITGITRGSVSVGMVTACGVPAVFDLLSDFHDRYPGIDITLAEDHSDALMKGVRDGRFDLALVGHTEKQLPGLAVKTLVDEPLVAAVGLGHPWASRSRATFAELVAQPLITMPTGTGIRSTFDAACRTSGHQPRIAFEASSADAVIRLARRGLGVAILAQSMTAPDARLHTLALTGPSVNSLLSFVWSAPTEARALAAASAPAARALIALLHTDPLAL